MKQSGKVELVACLFLLHTTLISMALAVEVNREEQGEAKRWVAAKFTGKIEPVTEGEDGRRRADIQAYRSEVAP